MTPLKPKEVRAFINDACDLTLPQAKKQFADFRAIEDASPDDPYPATITNLLDAIFYLRFGGQWRATAAPHVFLPAPTPTKANPQKPAMRDVTPPAASIIRHIARDLFR